MAKPRYAPLFPPGMRMQEFLEPWQILELKILYGGKPGVAFWKELALWVKEVSNNNRNTSTVEKKYEVLEARKRASNRWGAADVIYKGTFICRLCGLLIAEQVAPDMKVLAEADRSIDEHVGLAHWPEVWRRIIQKNWPPTTAMKP